MIEEWRIRIVLEEPPGPDLRRELMDAEPAPKRRIPGLSGRSVSNDTKLFRYAETEAGVRALEQRTLQRLAHRGAAGNVAIERLHPDTLSWEDPSVPLPSAEELEQSERRRAKSDERGIAQLSEASGVGFQIVDGILRNL